MVIDLSIFRTVIKDSYNQFIFYRKFDKNPRLNSQALPIALYCILAPDIADGGTKRAAAEALAFAGCEVLRQINNYFMLYKR